MENSIVNTLENLGYVRNDALKAELEAKSTRRLILDFILPCVVVEGGQDTRGWRLSSGFMHLMTVHAADFLKEDTELGELLFELALQRIQRHPRLKSIDYIDILPAEYKKYSAAWDQPGLWGKDEWKFMQLHLPMGLSLQNKRYSAHCRQLILEILSAAYPSDDSWFGRGSEEADDVVYKWVICQARQFCTPQAIAEDLLRRAQGMWRLDKEVYAQFAAFLDWDKFLDGVDLERETYYRGISRRVLKLFGCYNKATKKRIRREICGRV